MVSKFLAIAANTFREVIRQPVYGIIVGVAALSVMISPAFASFSMSEDVKIVKDMGLAAMLLSGLFMAGVSASAVLRRETENHTAATVLSKPVGRGTFVVAKHVGIVAALAVASYLVLVVLVHAVRMDVPMRASYKPDWPAIFADVLPCLGAVLGGAFANYMYNRPFMSTAVLLAVPLYTIALLLMCVIGREWTLTSFGAEIDRDTILAGILVFMAVTVLASVALAASTRLPTVAAILVCLGVLFSGMLSDYMFGRNVDKYLWHIESPPLPEETDTGVLGRARSPGTWARVGYATLPNLQAFWLGDALEKGKQRIPSRYLGWAAGYAALYQAGVLFVAVMLFRRKEVT